MRIGLCILVLILGCIASNSLAEQTFDYYAEAMKAYQAKDYAGCIFNLKKLVVTDDATSSRVMYNLACAYALNGQPEEAISYLKQLANRGLSFQVDRDSDFASLENNDAFRAVQKQFTRNLEPTNHSKVFLRTPESDFLAEGLAYNPDTKMFYSGSIHLRKIVSFDTSGRFQDFSASSDHLYSVLGLTVDSLHRKLWAATAEPTEVKEPDAGKSELVQYDLQTKKVIGKYPVPAAGPHGLGDVIVNSKGDAFATDSNSNVVYRVAFGEKELKLFAKSADFRSPQGLCLSANQQKLYIADYANGIYAIDIASRQITHLPAPPSSSVEGIDGLYMYHGSLIATQNGVNPKRVLQLQLNTEGTRIQHVEVLESGNSVFGEPTLGVIVDSNLYYIANNPDIGDLLHDPQTKLQPSMILKLQLPSAVH